MANRYLTVFLLSGMLVSCKESDIFNSAAVLQAVPEHCLTLSPDQSFDGKFVKNLSFADMNIVSDSILLIREGVANAESPYYYKAYSLSDCTYMGQLLRKGNGPGEFQIPQIVGHCNGTSCYAFDISLNRLFEFDLVKSMNDSLCCLVDTMKLPHSTLYAFPYKGGLRYVENIELDRVVSHLFDSEGDVAGTYSIYSDYVSAGRYISQLGHSVVLNPSRDKVAMFMLGLPQVGIMDLNTGEVASSAVDKEYKNWRKIISEYNTDSVIYYSDAEDAGDVILAVYRGISVAETYTPSATAHIHVFDWDGRFLYDFSLNENIRSIVYDRIHQYIYAMDAVNETIYRYDVSIIR